MYTLADYLKIDLSGNHFVHLGQMEESERLKLIAKSNDEYFKIGRSKFGGDGWEPNETDIQLHPLGKEVKQMDADWWSASADLDFSFIDRMLPHPQQSPSLDFMLLYCDYTGVHEDENLNEDKRSGIIAALLEAPHGCRLLHSNDQISILKEGDVVLLDDLPLHGAYPLEAAPAFEGEGIDARYAVTNHMKFAIIAKYHFDDDIPA